MPGEDYEQIEGLYPGLWFMERINLHQPAEVGKRVAVIGGGFTAMDCSRSSLRMGAEKVYVIYRRSRNEMLVYEEEAREAEIEGVDFRFLVSQTEVLHENGRGGGPEMHAEPAGRAGRQRAAKPCAHPRLRVHPGRGYGDRRHRTELGDRVGPADTRHEVDKARQAGGGHR